MGAFHHVSPHHLPLYLVEFDFRCNQLKVTDGDALGLLWGKPEEND